MLKKPLKGTIVYKVEFPWKDHGIDSLANMARVKWSDALNYPRTFSTLFRQVDGQWASGVEHPTGVYSHPFRIAGPEIQTAINQALTRKP